MINNQFELVKLAHENGGKGLICQVLINVRLSALNVIILTAPWPQTVQCMYLNRPNILKYAYENGCKSSIIIFKYLFCQ